jgi:RNA polymerase sigma-70 factor (ECF subfamily)
VKWGRDDWDSEDDAGRDADEATILAAARVDLRAFAPLYDRYYDPIFGFCLRRLRDREVAADATSQTFAQAMAALGSFRGGSFQGWLFAIARNAVIDVVRHQRPGLGLDAAGAVPDTGRPPDEQAIQAERHARLLTAIARLTPDQRNVVELRLAGLAGREIAEVLGLTIGAVQSSQFRAYRTLRRMLSDDPTFGEIE